MSTIEISLNADTVTAWIQAMQRRGVIKAGDTCPLGSFAKLLETRLELEAKPKIEIYGRRWFQKSFGNTYHTVKVYVDGQLVGESSRTYGYGDSYVQTAFEILQEKGYYAKTDSRSNGISDDWHRFTEERINERERFIISVQDVERQKDL